MRKHSETTSLRLQFDPLERRRLLDAGPMPSHHPDAAPVVAVQWAMISTYEPGGGDHGMPAGGAVDMGQDASSRNDGTGLGPGPGTPAWTDQTPDSGPGDAPPGNDPADPAAGSPGSAASTAPAAGGTPFAGVTSTNPPGVGTGNGGGGAAGATGAGLSNSTPGNPAGGSPSNGAGAADSLGLGREQFQPPESLQSYPTPPMLSPYMSTRDRSDMPEFGAAPSSQSNAASAPGGPAMAGAAAAMSVAAASGSPQGTPAPQSGMTIPPSPHLLSGDPAGGASDHGPAGAGAAARAETRAAADPSRRARGETRPVADATEQLAWNTAEPASAGEAPRPQGADLIAEALPFAGDSLERSLEDFVRQLRDVDVTRGPAPAMMASIAVATVAVSSVLAHEVVRRRSGRRGGLRLVDSRGRELALCFPDLPRSWSRRR